MTLQETIEVLRNHQYWRLGDENMEPTKPKELTKAISKAIAVLESLTTLSRYCQCNG